MGHRLRAIGSTRSGSAAYFQAFYPPPPHPSPRLQEQCPGQGNTRCCVPVLGAMDFGVFQFLMVHEDHGVPMIWGCGWLFRGCCSLSRPFLPPFARGGRRNGPYAGSFPLPCHFQGGGTWGGGGWVWWGDWIGLDWSSALFGRAIQSRCPTTTSITAAGALSRCPTHAPRARRLLQGPKAGTPLTLHQSLSAPGHLGPSHFDFRTGRAPSSVRPPETGPILTLSPGSTELAL